ncbi:MAG: glycosyltransferase [Candidatus Aminicenantes bacterium]|nr:glycosyltransferase [Candidatus Aminicenantes bacterium]
MVFSLEPDSGHEMKYKEGYPREKQSGTEYFSCFPDFRVCALIVTFNPDPLFPQRLEGIARQCPATIIIDNSTDGKSKDDLKKWTRDKESVCFISNRTNVGMAAALNMGIEWALEKGYEGVVTFDQDSESFPSQIESLKSIYMSHPQKAKIALIGSTFIETEDKISHTRPNKSSMLSWKPAVFVITSGCLLPLSTYLKLGSFREDFFIDDVDNEYCLRARRNGYRVLQIDTPLMGHTLGNPITISGLVSPLGKKIRTSGHPPLRRYFMARNTVILFREYFLSYPGPMLLKAYRLISALIYICFLEKDKIQKLMCSFLGIWDGLRKRFDRPIEKRIRG